MYLCSEGHDEVAHEGKNCPACHWKQKFSDMEDKVFDLETQIDTLESDLEDCERARKERQP